MSPEQRKEERFRQDLIASQSQRQKLKKQAADEHERRQMAKDMADGDESAFQQLWEELGDVA